MNDKQHLHPVDNVSTPHSTPPRSGGGGGGGTNDALTEIKERLTALETHYQYIAKKDDLSKAVADIAAEKNRQWAAWLTFAVSLIILGKMFFG